MPQFQRSERVRTGRDWGRARKARLRVSAEAISISVVPDTKKKLGVVVGSVVGNAVVRNRIKRVVREYFRLCRDEFPAGDCVVVIRPRAKGLANKEIREQLGAILKRIGKKL